MGKDYVFFPLHPPETAGVQLGCLLHGWPIAGFPGIVSDRGSAWEVDWGRITFSSLLCLCFKPLPCALPCCFCRPPSHPYVLGCNMLFSCFVIYVTVSGSFTYLAKSVSGQADLCACFSGLGTSLKGLGGWTLAAVCPVQGQLHESTLRWQGLHAEACASFGTTSLPLQVPPVGRLGVGFIGQQVSRPMPGSMLCVAPMQYAVINKSCGLFYSTHLLYCFVQVPFSFLFLVPSPALRTAIILLYSTFPKRSLGQMLP